MYPLIGREAENPCPRAPQLEMCKLHSRQQKVGPIIQSPRSCSPQTNPQCLVCTHCCSCAHRFFHKGNGNWNCTRPGSASFHAEKCITAGMIYGICYFHVLLCISSYENQNKIYVQSFLPLKPISSHHHHSLFI